MAAATSKLTVNAFPSGGDNPQKQYVAYGTCALSTSGTYSTNGVPVNWMALYNPDGSVFQPQVSASQTTPIVAYFTSLTGGANGSTAVYSYLYDQTHNTLRIFAGAVELANAATIVVDTIGF